MINKYILLASFIFSLLIISCKDVPPIIPGLTKSEVLLVTDPDSVIINFNSRTAGNLSPYVISDLEPGFYRFDLSRKNYLDTTIFYLLKRNVEDSIYVEMREDPKFWWKTYNTKNSNLPTNYLSKIRVDNSNNKWITTTNYGLIKYDGSIFTVYNIKNSGIPSNSINDIFFDGNIVWVGTDHGLGSFDGSNWKVYNSANSQIPNDYISAVAIDHNKNLWAGTEAGLLKFDGVTFEVYNRSNSGISSDIISALAVDQNNALWIGTWGGGISKLDNLTWNVYTSYNSKLLDNYVSFIKTDNAGMIWAGTGSINILDHGISGLSYFRNSTWYNMTRYNSGFLGSVATDVAFDVKNNIWIATDIGLIKYEGNRWRYYYSSNSGLPLDQAVSVAVDANQDKWVSSSGLSKYTGGK